VFNRGFWGLRVWLAWVGHPAGVLGPYEASYAPMVKVLILTEVTLRKVSKQASYLTLVRTSFSRRL